MVVFLLLLFTVSALFFSLCLGQEAPHVDYAQCTIAGIDEAPLTAPGFALKVMDTMGVVRPWVNLCVLHSRRLHVVLLPASLGSVAHIHPEDFAAAIGNYTVYYKIPWVFPWTGTHGAFFDFALETGGGCDAALAEHMRTHMSNTVDPLNPAESILFPVADFERLWGLPRGAPQQPPRGCGPWLPSPSNASVSCLIKGQEGKLTFTTMVPLVDVDAAAELPALPKSAPVFRVSLETIPAGAPAVTGECTMFRVLLADARTGVPLTDMSPYLEAAAHVAVVAAGLTGYVHAHGFSGDDLRAMQRRMPSMPDVPTCESVRHLGMSIPAGSFGPDIYFFARFTRPGPHVIVGQTAVRDSILLNWFFQITVSPKPSPAPPPSSAAPSSSSAPPLPSLNPSNSTTATTTTGNDSKADRHHRPRRGLFLTPLAQGLAMASVFLLSLSLLIFGFLLRTRSSLIMDPDAPQPEVDLGGIELVPIRRDDQGDMETEIFDQGYRGLNNTHHPVDQENEAARLIIDEIIVDEGAEERESHTQLR